jgi:hypothetical protein
MPRRIAQAFAAALLSAFLVGFGGGFPLRIRKAREP